MQTKPFDRIVKRIRAKRGLPVRVAEVCGINRAAVYQWRRVPIKWVYEVAGLLDIPPDQIRPDVFRKARRR